MICFIPFTAIICNTSYTTNASLVEETGNMIGDVRYYRCPLGWRVNNSEPATATFSISCELDDDQLAGRWTKPPLCTGKRDRQESHFNE